MKHLIRFMICILILLTPALVSPGERDLIERKLREAHQRLALSYIELNRLDPRPPVQAYLMRFYDLNKGPFQVKYANECVNFWGNLTDAAR